MIKRPHARCNGSHTFIFRRKSPVSLVLKLPTINDEFVGDVVLLSLATYVAIIIDVRQKSPTNHCVFTCGAKFCDALPV